MIRCKIRRLGLEVGAVAELFGSHGINGDRLRIAHGIPHKIDHMHAEINERPAAGARFVAEPAAGVAVAAQIGRFGIIDVAERVAVDKFF